MGVAVHHEKIVPKQESRFESYYYVDDLINDGLELVKQNEHLAHEILRPDKFFTIRTFESEKGNRNISIQDIISTFVLQKANPLLSTGRLLQIMHGRRIL